MMRIGGVTGWMRAAAIAGTAGVPMSTHLYTEVAAHVMRVTETAHSIESASLIDPILVKPYSIARGRLEVPDLPGVGLQVKPRRHREISSRAVTPSLLSNGLITVP